MITNLGQFWDWRRRYPYSIGDPTKMDRFSMKWGKPGSTVELCKGDEILLTIRYIKLSDAGTYTDQLGTETAYDSRENMWLAYMRYTAKTLQRKDCVICAHTRPVLATQPFALGKDGCVYWKVFTMLNPTPPFVRLCL
jgi:hypothetical protein